MLCDNIAAKLPAAALTTAVQATSISEGWSFKTYMYSDMQLLHGNDDALPPCLEEAWCLPALSKAEQLPRAVDMHVSCDSLATEYKPVPGCPPPGLLTLHVSRDLLAGGTGCHEWEAGLFLAEWVLSNPAMFQGQHSSSVCTQRPGVHSQQASLKQLLCAGKACLELGCGTGAVGVALSRVAAGPIWLTDGNADALENCARNLGVNNVPCILEPSGSTFQTDTKQVRQSAPAPCCQVPTSRFEGSLMHAGLCHAAAVAGWHPPVP